MVDWVLAWLVQITHYMYLAMVVRNLGIGGNPQSNFKLAVTGSTLLNGDLSVNNGNLIANGDVTLGNLSSVSPGACEMVVANSTNGKLYKMDMNNIVNPWTVEALEKLIETQMWVLEISLQQHQVIH